MKTLDDLQNFLIRRLPECRIYLFGSRARGDTTPYSDVDVAIDAPAPLHGRLSRIRWELEASNLPFKVDLVDLSEAAYLKKIVEKEGVAWH